VYTGEIMPIHLKKNTSLHRVSILIPIIVMTGCAPVMMDKAALIPSEKQEARWDHGYQVVFSKKENSSVSLGLQSQKHYPDENIGFSLSVLNSSTNSFDIGTDNIQVTIGGRPAHVISAEERLDEVRKVYSREHRRIAIAAALSGMNGSTATTTGTFSASSPGQQSVYGNYTQQTTYYDQTAAAIRQQNAHQQMREASEQEERSIDVINKNWLSRSTLSPESIAAGYFEVEPQPYTKIGERILVEISIGAEKHVFDIQQTPICVKNCNSKQ
jgi:hypothetical protein